MFATFHVDTHPELNPYIGSTLQETTLNCASALRWVCAIDVERLSDKAADELITGFDHVFVGRDGESKEGEQ
ncbi:hypothetical protein HW932_19160 [Allochromatium humboldtianum]|uniref:Uncharacterized protein n=1 Tax=Allochromatium humboldtianum TaxID=504901 RepID=A0A850RR41_9GAMM|nr:hypothetical protein [Allochromatium humboldtianum]NVZ11373.1 hypothetical protein [Allochromatium humboldtianum]